MTSNLLAMTSNLIAIRWRWPGEGAVVGGLCGDVAKTRFCDEKRVGHHWNPPGNS